MAKRLSKAEVKLYLGSEPDLRHEDVTESELGTAYNWYNSIYNSDHAKEFVIEYLRDIKFDKKTIRLLNQVKSYELRTIGWNCRILRLGGTIPPAYKERMWSKIEKLTKNLEDIKEEQVAEKPAIDIQARIDEKVSDYNGEIEGEIDDFLNAGKSEFNIRDWLRNNEIKPMIAQRIADHFKPLYSELFDAINNSKNDEQLKEAYKFIKKPALKQYLEFVKDIIAACETRVVAAKATRKPRKKKEKPAATIVAKMKFKDKDGDYTSINPKEIVGANQLWVFNTKYRMLGVFNAMGPVGLNVKGTTIIGFDEKTSIAKKLRKPDVIIPRMLTGGKVVLRRIMDEIKAKPKTLKGRINGETLLLKVVK
jgi:hypothetical protein